MFSSFTFDSLAEKITSAAQNAQETLNTAAQNAQETINNTILSPDVQTKLQFKKTTRYLQEKVGTVADRDISKLPDGYSKLEEKTIAFEKILKRLLEVTETFEIDGYDYPPNLSESLTIWWNDDEKRRERENDKLNEKSILNKSFALAICKAVIDSKYVIEDLQTKHVEDKKQSSEKSTESTDAQNTEGKQSETEDAKDQDEEDENEEEEEEDEDEDEEDLIVLTSAFKSWSTAYKNIDQSKKEMDDMIIKEFNQKLKDILAIDFKTVNKLRTKVQDSRLEFDTLRYEIRLKELEREKKLEEKKKEQGDKKEAQDETDNKEEETANEDKPEVETETEVKTEKSSNEEGNKKPESQEGTKEATKEEPANVEDPEIEEENKLLEQLEDDFVSNISAAVEKMTDITDSTELISLIKLFQNIQLVHHRQCVQELENSMKFLDELTVSQ